jgi:ubiquinone/menaquinone biosynthesis C-methylase UbiE
MSFWRWKAPVYSFARRHLPLFSHLLAAEKSNLAKLVQQLPPLPGAHLDLGSGTGDHLSILPASPKRLAVDFNFNMLKRNPTVHRLVARGEQLPFRDKHFLFISAIGLLEYLGDSEFFFNEVRRVLRPEGYFLFTSSPPKWTNRMRLVWGEKLFFYSERQLRAILKAGGWRVIGHERSWLQEQWLAVNFIR